MTTVIEVTGLSKHFGRVRAVESQERGDGVVVLTTGARLKVTRARREVLERKLEALHDAG